MPSDSIVLDSTSTVTSQSRIERFLNIEPDVTGEMWNEVLIEALILLGICAAVWFITRWIARVIMKGISGKTKTEFDDFLLEHNFFKWLANIIPALILEAQERQLLADIVNEHSLIYRLTDALIVIMVMLAVVSFVSASRDYLSKRPSLRDKPIHSYSQLLKIFIYFFSGVIVFSILSEKSPVYFLSAMGAMTAVILLIFKDTILGFVASIQLSANDMVRIGDWVSMPKYEADGDVIEINLTTIKVENFDKTITTIPTYSFISDSFKNWRGMQESDGRRIKRSLNIKMGTVKFCDDALLDRLSNIQIITSYISEKRTEIADYNTKHDVDKSVLVNGRHLTNIGIFRIYLQNYLNANPHINQNMTCMVRQLAPTEYGIPIEVYAFSKVKDWGKYEEIVADLFDHFMASAEEFELEVFQNPTGTDFAKMLNE